MRAFLTTVLLLPLASCGSAVVSSHFAPDAPQLWTEDGEVKLPQPVLIHAQPASLANGDMVESPTLHLLRDRMRAVLEDNGVAITESESNAKSALILRQDSQQMDWTEWRHVQTGDDTASSYPVEHHHAAYRFTVLLYQRDRDAPLWTGIGMLKDGAPTRALEKVAVRLTDALLDGEEDGPQSIYY